MYSYSGKYVERIKIEYLFDAKSIEIPENPKFWSLAWSYFIHGMDFKQNTLSEPR